eukprot:4323145-Prymnesium_polylepis.3
MVFAQLPTQRCSARPRAAKLSSSRCICFARIGTTTPQKCRASSERVAEPRRGTPRRSRGSPSYSVDGRF